MKEKILYCIWAVLYIICVGLGTTVERSLGMHIVLELFALAFFVPGILLVHLGITTGDKKVLLHIRLACIASLVSTLSLFIVNILGVFANKDVGQVLHDLLNLVSAPMFCSYWQWTSLFLWACLLISRFPRMWKK